MWYPGVKIQCRGCYGYHKKEFRCNQKISFGDYLQEFKINNPELPMSFLRLGDEESDNEPEHSNNLNNTNKSDINYNTTNTEKTEEQESKTSEQGEQEDHVDHGWDEDRFAFLDSPLREKIKLETNTKSQPDAATETEEVKIQLSKRTLNCQQVEDWSIEELQDYLLYFTPTEDETLWLRNNNDYNVCDTEEDAMPFFKTIINKRLLADSGM